MADMIWYWEYQIKIWNETDNQVEVRSGVITAETFTKAVQALEDYYIDEIIEIQMLKAIIDGEVFEFQYVMEDTDFDYIINRKKSGEIK